ncbi:MAG: cyclic peptide export ABC transporter [Candidatus Aminicenantes bacterium]|nr:cyclic peptide export ABC transporter [Candidatus Aminicenantes bacterium]NIM84633.1 cyclic peptide export ABC transporter [Candidatus Aminicenantes bacterium]NIN24138.1 cyclic peptide export ABC transporter [Candidatus Aminicenantes bacterium]NIN47862.1 cyclic peptide export ABC transporter [Candidatus Aminicenantes bacterium]NIN90800.1 cyclic peptide export ABC transporter [Candidatus Aminicenantes bacterium]
MRPVTISLKMVVLFVFAVFFLSVSLGAEMESKGFSIAEIEKTVQELMEEGDIPGLSLVILRADGANVVKGFGYADLEKEVPVTSGTLFELASCSKSFTALAALQLAAQGLIRLDDNVSDYFPGFFVKYEGQTYPVTIRQLLHQTSGIPANTIDLIPKGNDKDALEQTVKNVSGIELNHIPGQKFEYATVNYAIVGAIIEKVSHKDFETYMAENIFKPLGLTSTAVGVYSRSGHKAKGYKIGFFSPRAYDAPAYRGNDPAANVLSNAKDMARWLQIQMGLVETELTPLIQKTHRRDRTIAVGTANLSSYAMGWFVSLVGEKQLSHTGLNPNFTSYVGFRPEKKIGVAVLANSNSNHTAHIGNYILGALVGEDKSVHVPDSGLDRTASVISILLAVLLAACLVYVVFIIRGIFRGRRDYAPLTMKKVFGIIGGLLATVPLLIGVHLLPRLLADVSWETAVVWAPLSLPAAAVLLLAVLGAAAVISILSLLFPEKDQLKRVLPFAVALSAVSGVANAAVLFIVINAFFLTQAKTYLLYYFILGVFVSIGATKVGQTMLIKTANGVVYDLRLKLINKMFSTRYQRFETLDSGEIYTTINNDTDTLGNTPNTFMIIVTGLVTLASIFAYLAILAPVPTLMTLGIIFVIIVFYSIVGQRAQRLMDQARDTQDVFMRLIDGLVKGFKELVLHRNKKMEYNNELQDVCLEFREKRDLAYIKFVNVMVIGNSMLIFLLGIISFGFEKMFPALPSYTLLSFIFIFVYMIGPITMVMGAVPEATKISVSWNRIQNFLKETPEQPPAALPEEDFIRNKTNVENLKARDILFKYESKDEHETFILGPLDFEANKGEVLFVTGGNGSGKTTLAKILTGLYIPAKGTIEIDGKEVNNGQLGEYYSVVFSDFHLFEKLYNVNLENRDQEIQEYLKILDLEGKVHIEDGAFSTLDLSGGQRKRLALLKCYLEDFPIYLFDEWAADQDPEFRKFFYRTLLPKMKEQGKIVIAITHDDNYFDAADKIIKLDIGKIELIENGKHPQFMNKPLVFEKAGTEVISETSEFSRVEKY